MPEARLSTDIWVHAYRRRLDLLGIPAMITAKGDKTAGAVLVKLATLDGKAKAFTRRFDLMTGIRQWDVLTEGNEVDVDQSIATQRSFDPDLWVIEVEDRQGRHLLDEDGLA
jgi:hypothetical protein